jgi:hypothetical protein
MPSSISIGTSQSMRMPSRTTLSYSLMENPDGCRSRACGGA